MIALINADAFIAMIIGLCLLLISIKMLSVMTSDKNK